EIVHELPHELQTAPHFLRRLWRLLALCQQLGEVEMDARVELAILRRAGKITDQEIQQSNALAILSLALVQLAAVFEEGRQVVVHQGQAVAEPGNAGIVGGQWRSNLQGLAILGLGRLQPVLAGEKDTKIEVRARQMIAKLRRASEL